MSRFFWSTWIFLKWPVSDETLDTCQLIKFFLDSCHQYGRSALVILALFVVPFSLPILVQIKLSFQKASSCLFALLSHPVTLVGGSLAADVPWEDSAVDRRHQTSSLERNQSIPPLQLPNLRAKRSTAALCLYRNTID